MPLIDDMRPIFPETIFPEQRDLKNWQIRFGGK
jgi:hypothetical protein